MVMGTSACDNIKVVIEEINCLGEQYAAYIQAHNFVCVWVCVFVCAQIASYSLPSFYVFHVKVSCQQDLVWWSPSLDSFV